MLFMFESHAQWTEKKAEQICKAVEREDWKLTHRKIKQLIKHWSYLDTSLGYPQYGLAIDSIVGLMAALPCTEMAYADFCTVKLMIWPGRSIIGVRFRNDHGTMEFCYHIQEGKTKALIIRPMLYIPLGSKEKMVFTSWSECSGFIEEQKRICEEEEKRRSK